MNYEQKYLDIVRCKLLELASDVEGEIFLFGSRAKELSTRSSDLDIGFDRMSPEAFRSVSCALFDFLDDSIVPWDVDLVYWPSTNSEFRTVADRNKIVWKHG